MAKGQDKHKKHKQWCENYKKSGQREINKALKQKRHEKRMAKFAKRREDGKSYEYKQNPYKKGTRKWWDEHYKRASKNVDHRTEVASNDSLMRKLQNELDAEAQARKQEEQKRTKKKSA